MQVLSMYLSAAIERQISHQVAKGLSGITIRPESKKKPLLCAHSRSSNTPFNARSTACRRIESRLPSKCIIRVIIP